MKKENLYFIYMYDFKLGSYLLGAEGTHIKSVITSINRGDGIVVIWSKLFSSGITLFSALLIGGIIIGIFAAVPTYFIFLKIFQKVREWRRKRKAEKDSRLKKRKITKHDNN